MSNSNEKVGIGKLRLGFLILIVVSLLSLVNLFRGFITTNPTVSQNINNTNTQQLLSQILSNEVSQIEEALIFTSIVAVINIIGMIILRGGFNALSKAVSNDIGIGSTGTILYIISYPLGIIGNLILLNGILSSSFFEILISLPFSFIEIILLLIGSILLGIGVYRVGREYNNTLVKVGGIFIAIIILAFIGSILSYIGLGKVKPISVTQSVQIYPLGQGVIKRDGSAKVAIYSSTKATILSVKIEGTKIFTFNVNPVNLSPGNNEIVIQFNDISSLVENSIYVITLIVDVSGNSIPVNVNAIYQGSQ
ncbi:DUF973 family protein [Sulfolobus sp. E5-1-F]|uniref:DUF973 family protein n=1 Tax=Sulfolobaceae TaxID=118883 RepID=UPI0012969705|nr:MULTISPECIES: DUF973 family protein [unclassified Sulfolobus]QGA54036.1 DUF973 family protein [Sulfolobus sp. E5-1-F]QGA69096.1 DUF973 family protein [Sulfolobus sp. E11-6]